jgi:peptide/nickel transport system substrate-binding protein
MYPRQSFVWEDSLVMSRTLRRGLPLAIILTLVVSACQSPAGTAPTSAGPGASTKDTIVIAQGTDAISLDPAKHTTFTTQSILWHIYEPLVTRDATGTYKPMLATEWKTLNDTTWQFKLRPDVKFHNGDPFTADDVKFTFDRALDPATKSPTRANLTAITRVDVVDPLTVNFVTNGAYPLLLYRLTEVSDSSVIVPMKYLKANGDDILATKPIGTGPYTFVSWKKDEQLELATNPSYWGPKPAIKRAIFRPIPEAAARIAELKSGGVDLIVNVPPEQVPSLNTGATKVDIAPSDFTMMVVFNTLEPGPLQNKAVRQALNYAVDVDSIIKNVMGGFPQRIAVSLAKEAFGYPKSVQPYTYDPVKAKQMLTDAGYPNGFKIPFLSRSGRYLKDREVVEAVAGYLNKVGVQTDLQFVEPGVWSEISNKKGRSGLSYPGWSGPDAELVYYNILFTGQLQSYYSNKELDALITAGRTTLDQAARTAAYDKAGQLIKDEAPHIALFQIPLLYARSQKLAWTARGDEIIDLRTASFR